jgi:hypothetical protein
VQIDSAIYDFSIATNVKESRKEKS